MREDENTVTFRVGLCIPCRVEVTVQLIDDGEDFEILSGQIVGESVAAHRITENIHDDDFEFMLEQALRERADKGKVCY